MIDGSLRTAAAASCAAAAIAAAAAVYIQHRRRRRRNAPPPSVGAHTATRGLGKRPGAPQVTVLGQGGASLGDLYVTLPNDQALATLEAAHACGINFFDTSPWYGVGLSEARFGLALFRRPRDSFLLQTKVGRRLIPDAQARNGVPTGWLNGYHFTYEHEYSAAAFTRQMEDSLQRTGLGRIDSLVIHDLEPSAAGAADAAKGDDGVARARGHLKVLQDSGIGALRQMRAAGRVRAFGAGVNVDEDGENPQIKRAWNREYVDVLLALGADGHGLDFLLAANLYSLLNHEAHTEGLLDKCLAAGVGVVVGGPYSSGILATGSGARTPMYNYQPASEEVLARTRGIEAVCARHGVPLIAAALQFPLGHPAVSCVIPGGKSPTEVRSNVALMNVRIPPVLWAELKREGLLPEDVRTP